MHASFSMRPQRRNTATAAVGSAAPAWLAALLLASCSLTDSETATAATAGSAGSTARAARDAAPGPMPTPTTITGKPVRGQIVAKEGQVIENVHVKTSSGPCVVIKGVRNVTIRDSEIGPCGGPGDPTTQGVLIERASDVRIERNVIHDVSSGVYVLSSRHPIVMDRNYVYNVRGPSPRGQMIQMNGVTGGSAGSKVTCNVSDAMPATRHGAKHGETDDGVEDHISMFKSPGLDDERTEIAYNRLRGGHKHSKSGSGINLGDMGGGNAYVHDNIVVNVANVGIGISGGRNVSIENNRIYQDRDHGVYVNLGLMVWAQAGAACTGGHTVRNNRVWTVNWRGEQNNYWNAGNCGDVPQSGNVLADKSLTPDIFDEVPAACR
jgi:hypothetical protein